MEFELRSILLVIGLIVIAAILIHGLISIRKSNKPVDLSGIDLREEDDQGKLIRDRSGFDRHGVGVARKIDHEDEISQEVEFDSGFAKSFQDQQVAFDLPQTTSLDSSLDSAADSVENSAETAINFDVALDGNEAKTPQSSLVIDPPQAPVFDSPIEREKPEAKVFFEPGIRVQGSVCKVNKQTKIKVEAATAPITTEKSIPEPTTKPAAETPVEAEPLDVLVLNVVARDDNELDGARLLPILLTLGFKFGEMDIFHRHSNSAGHGPVLFSLANMVNPGVFDVDNMEQFSTTGVSLFMRLPHSQGNIKTFNIMLNAAAKIAEEFDGQVLDGNRNILTNQQTNQYVERIHAVERQVSNTK